jgi:GNAT superfamily N-acetyltransferase
VVSIEPTGAAGSEAAGAHSGAEDLDRGRRRSLSGPGVGGECEAILRTLPGWFGIEASLLEYARDADRLPTFIAREAMSALGFITLQQHFERAWEVHCIAVAHSERRRGIGRSLHAHAEEWLRGKGATMLQVKTVAEGHSSKEYAETRRFYERIGYTPLEVFNDLWHPNLPVLQLLKVL